MNDITQKYLVTLFKYDKHTGSFTRLVSKGGGKKGTVAGNKNKVTGYIQIRIKGKLYFAHRLVYLYIHGGFPDNEIDHINHIRSDNRYKNLREVSHKENHRNRTKNTNNTSGVTGVFFDNQINRWVSVIYVDGSRIRLGSFSVFHEAVDSRKNAEILYGFHKKHGESL